MYNVILLLHSFLRWVIIILAIVSIYRSFAGMRSGGIFSAADKKVGLFLLIAAHTTLLLGLYLWFVGPWGLMNIRNLGFGAIMKDPYGRYYAVEHTTGMLIAIVLITIGRGVAKKNIPDAAKLNRTFWFILLALVIILATVPWPFRALIGKPWL